MIEPVFIVDTNVLVAGLLTGNGDSPVAQILDRMLSGRIIYLLSPALVDEYRKVLVRPKLTRLHGLRATEIEHLVVELATNAIWRDPLDAPPAPDPGANHLWALLATYPGSILITGDKLLLERPPERSSVISPTTYVNEFAQSDQSPAW